MMKVKIIAKESFPVIGIELKTTSFDGKNFHEIPKFWEKVLQEQLIDKIPNKKNPNTTLGICCDFQTDGSFSYIIGAEVINTEDIPSGMICRMVPAAQYALFTACGEIPKSIQDTIKYIEEWLPNSNYVRAGTADFELYDERSCNGENAEVDIYIPIESS